MFKTASQCSSLVKKKTVILKHYFLTACSFTIFIIQLRWALIKGCFL
uniref:Uncharacterized protein n=1 Tax=Rhizophora mucronata TaxID=61149 RepID=A0A2P2R181_RHIMU